MLNKWEWHAQPSICCLRGKNTSMSDGPNTKTTPDLTSFLRDLHKLAPCVINPSYQIVMRVMRFLDLSSSAPQVVINVSGWWGAVDVSLNSDVHEVLIEMWATKAGLTVLLLTRITVNLKRFTTYLIFPKGIACFKR